MDFALSEEQDALRGLAKQILGDATAAAALREVEAGDGLHRALWRALGEAGLLGLGVSEDRGGLGLGDFTDVCLLLEQVGRHVAPVPALESLVMGVLPLARFGGDRLRQDADLAGVIGGRRVLTGALMEAGSDDPLRPGARATPHGDGWRLQGVKVGVPFLGVAHRVLVLAALPGGRPGAFLLDPAADGATVEAGRGTHDLPLGRLGLDGAFVAGDALLGGPDGAEDAARWTVERATVGACAVALGVAEKALHLTAKHVSTREQFGVPLGTFQAVSQRAGDAWIDVESMRLVVQRASWLLAAEREAGREVAVARVVSADAAHRVACSAIHLHGGIGFDRDYALYRYFLWTKHLEFLLGAAPAALARLGDRLAAEAGRP